MISIFLKLPIDILDVVPRSRISRGENVTYVTAVNAVKQWEMMESGMFLGFRMMCKVTDAARKTAVDSCTFEVKAWSLRGFAVLKGPAESTMTASAHVE
jgi:hypothetical protein